MNLIGKKIVKNYFSLLKRSLNNDCLSSLKINILRDIDETRANLSRIKGIPTIIDFYDSHRQVKNIRYLQSSLKTILILPGVTTNYKIYEYLIEFLFQKLNYRVLALNFPGVGESKLLKDDLIYIKDIKQQSRIVTTFVCELLPFRDKPIDYIIALNDSCYIVPFLGIKNDLYRGNKSMILINPTSPSYIKVFKSSISDAGKEQFFNLHRKLMIQQVCLQQIKNKELAKNLNYDHLLNEFLTWNSINSFVIEQALNSLMSYSKNCSIVLYENDNYYDQEINSDIKKQMKDNLSDESISIIKNENVALDRDYELSIDENKNRFFNNFKEDICNLCFNFIQRLSK